jgi:hypothetical protein
VSSRTGLITMVNYREISAQTSNRLPSPSFTNIYVHAAHINNVMIFQLRPQYFFYFSRKQSYIKITKFLNLHAQFVFLDAFRPNKMPSSGDVQCFIQNFAV